MTPAQAHNIFVNGLDTDPRREEAAAVLKRMATQLEAAVAWHADQVSYFSMGAPSMFQLEELYRILTEGNPPSAEDGEV